MKRFYLLLIVSVLAGGLFSSANAAEVLDDWTFGIWQGNITMTPSGTTANIQTPGSDLEEWAHLHKYFSNAIGVLATFNITSINGNASMGLRKNLGTTSDGNRILAEVYLHRWSGDGGEYRTRCRVRKRDDQGNTLKILAQGFLGDFDGGWSIGQNVDIALARTGDDEVCFYTPANGAFIKVKLFEPMGDLESDVEITTWADLGSDNRVSGTVSDVNVIYPNDLMIFEDAVPKKRVVVVPMF